MRKSKLLVFAVLMLAVLTVFASCDKDDKNPDVTTDAHEHTFKTEWTYDEDNHWYAASCEHSDEKANLAPHVDENNDGVCDVCSHGSDHEHTFATEYSHDETNHWYASSCGHDVKKDEAAHADANNDSVCDACGYDYGHTHTYADAWTQTATHHYHAVTCGHAVANKDEAEHVDANNDGVCDTCAYVMCAHTYATEWSHDATNHWHAATCAHTTLVSDKGAHADANNDGVCDTCAWNYDHEHTFATGDDWTKDDQGHWHAANCGHAVSEKKDYAAHTLTDSGLCSVCGYANHEHTYATDWTHDGVNHWHAASCGCDLKSDLGAHADANNDGICDTCLWNYDHEHTFNEDVLVSDGTNHFYGPSCGHNVPGLNVEACTDVNNDGLCDVCAGKLASNTCTDHTFSTEWSTDANSHWHAPTCSHTGVRKDEADHIDEDYNDVCDTCGYKYFTIVDEASSDESSAKVNSGTISIITAYDNVTVNYEFGKDLFIYTDSFDNQYWYFLVNGNVATIIYDGSSTYPNPDGAEANNLLGYPVYGYYFNLEGNQYGIENLVYSLYQQALASANGDVVVTSDAANGKYSFAYSYCDGYVLSNVTVSFTVNADKVILEANVKADEYYLFDNGFIMVDGKGYVTASAPQGTTTVTVTQTVGERTKENIFASKFVTSYVLKDAEGNLVLDGHKFNVKAGDTIVLKVSDILPTTADFTVDSFQIEAPWWDGVSASYDSETGEITINCYSMGQKSVTIKTALTDMITLNIDVEGPAPSEINPNLMFSNGMTSDENSAQIMIGETLFVGATVNEGADGAFVVELIDGDASKVELVSNETVYNFTASAVGTYVLKITSTRDGSVSCELTVTVVEKPTVAETLNGKYNVDFYGTKPYTITFTPASAGAVNGTLEVIANEGGNAAFEGTYTYAYLTDGIEIKDANGALVNFSIDLDTETMTLYFNSFMTLVKDDGTTDVPVEIPAGLLEALNGKYNADFYGTICYEVTFVPEADGRTGGIEIVDLNGTGYTGAYSYTINNDLMIELSDSSILITYDENYGLYIQTPSQRMPIALTKAEQGGDTPVEIPEQLIAALNGKYEVNFFGVQVIYQVTFTPDSAGASTGTLEVVDLNNGPYSGTYTYLVNADLGIEVSNPDIMITYDLGYNLSFQVPSLMMAQPLTKVEGGDTPGGDTTGELVLGENSVEVTDTWNGTEVTFTATEAGTYVVTAPEAGNAWIFFENATGMDSFGGPDDFVREFTLGAGESITLRVCTWSEMPGTATFTIELKGDAPVVEIPEQLIAALNGNYELVMPGMGTLYTLAFYPNADGKSGTIVMTDANMFVYNGTYTYTINADLGIEVSDPSIMITYDMGYSLYLQCQGMMRPTQLTKAEGGDTPGGENPTELVLGENTVTVSDAWAGAILPFTATEAGTYVFNITDANAVLGYDYTNYYYGEEVLEIYLAAGQTVEIMIFTANWEPGTVSFSIEYAGNEAPTGDLVLGENSVEVPQSSVYTGVSVDFVASVAGTYIITATDTNAWIIYEHGFEMDAIGFEQTIEVDLVEGQTLTLVVMTDSWTPDTIEFTIELKGGDEPIIPDGEGTTADPIIIEQNGNYICNFPGGATPVFYKYVATEKGTLTLTFTGDDYFLLYGLNANATVVYQDATLTLDVVAGDVLNLAIANWSEAAGDIPFTFEFVKYVEPEEPEVVIHPLAGVLNGAYYFDFVVNEIYVITFNPSEENAVDGILAITDNYKGDMEGNYKYAFNENNELVITNEDGTALTKFVLTYLADEEKLVFSNEYISVPQELLRVKDPFVAPEELLAALNGKYEVVFLEMSLYVITITPAYEGAYSGSLVIVDNNGGTYNGSYSYYINDEGKIVVSDSTVSLTYDEEFTLYFSNTNLTTAQPLTVYIETAELVFGDNSLTLEGDYALNGIESFFTADNAGDYVITAGDGTVIVYNGKTIAAGKNTIVTLAAGEEISMFVKSESGEAATVCVNISLVPIYTTPAEILSAAYELASGEILSNGHIYTLTGIITKVNTAFSSQYNNVTVTIVVDGMDDKAIQCFRLKGDGADVIKVGDTITVSGKIKNYNGTVEFDSGCNLDSYVPCIPSYDTPEEIVNAAYGLASGASMSTSYTLTGVITVVDTPYSSQYGNVTVTIVVGDMTDKPIMCYRMKGTGADVIKTGDTVTVTGILKNYNGKIEFDAGCTLDSYVPGQEEVIIYETPEEIINAAYELEQGKTLSDGYLYELTGVITKIKDAYSTEYKNISVIITVGNMTDKPILCYRLKGDAAASLKVGDIVTVKGTLKNYYGTIEFDSGCTIEDHVAAPKLEGTYLHTADLYDMELVLNADGTGYVVVIEAGVGENRGTFTYQVVATATGATIVFTATPATSVGEYYDVARIDSAIYNAENGTIVLSDDKGDMTYAVKPNVAGKYNHVTDGYTMELVLNADGTGNLKVVSVLAGDNNCAFTYKLIVAENGAISIDFTKVSGVGEYYDVDRIVSALYTDGTITATDNKGDFIYEIAE